MVFSGLVFLFLFLPITLLLYYLSPKKIRNVVLLVMNLIFYGYGEPVFLLLMIGSIAANYTLGRMVHSACRQWMKKTLLIFSVVLNLSALAWFKYAGLFIDTLREVGVFRDLTSMKILLPVGISFYTFQAMSYVIDVYRGQCKASKNIVDFATYISLFPQLIAGPIVRYSDVALQLQHRDETIEKFSWGVKMFCVGLAKKVLLANQFALLWNVVSADPQLAGTLWAWAGIVAFSLQIYFDFAGYSDMARGLGAMFGFDFCINFDYPYISKSITEFWRRWHISLSTWFRDYVYIPLGGSRKGSVRTAVNLMIVWMLTGFWHGAGWNFLFWGFYYGVLLVLEKFVLNRWLEYCPVTIKRVYTLLLAVCGWVFFACNDFSAVVSYFNAMFVFEGGLPALQLLPWLPLLIIGIFASLPAMSKLWHRWERCRILPFVEALLCLFSLVLSTASLVSGSYNPFLYFRF